MAILEQSLSEEQSRHAQEMNDLAANLRARLEKLQAQQKSSLAELEQSRASEVEVLSSRVEKAGRDREEANQKLVQFGEMYEHLEKHFHNPAEGSVSR